MKMKLFACIVLFSINASAYTIKGKVDSIISGDTFVLIDMANTWHTVRMAEIDAPESGQPYGDRSKDVLSALIYEKSVTVEWEKRDENRNIFGLVFLDGKNINNLMVNNGFAWVHQFSNSDELLYIMDGARGNKRGLWADDDAPIPPWQWREEHRGVVGYPPRPHEPGYRYMCRDVAIIVHRSASCSELEKCKSPIIEIPLSECKTKVQCELCNYSVSHVKCGSQ